MNELALFSGAGGGILGGKLLGWRTVCAVELDEYAANVLLARQNDGSLPPFPIWNDIRSFSARNNQARPAIRALRRIRNSLVISGGFPCTDISVAGRGEGLDGQESSLWRHQRRIIGEIRPIGILVENSPALTVRGGVRVVGDLAALGYDCRWGIVSAADAIWLGGTPCLDHLRERIWIAGTRADADRGRELQSCGRLGEERGRVGDLCLESAHPDGAGLRQQSIAELGGCGSPFPLATGEAVADAGSFGCERAGSQRDKGRRAMLERGGPSHPHANDSGRIEQRPEVADGPQHEAAERRGWWSAEPGVGRMAHGVPSRVAQLRCAGNAQVPHAMALAWEILTR